MSYFSPVNAAEIGFDRFDPALAERFSCDGDDTSERGERERLGDDFKAERRETRADELREFRERGQRCDREERGDRDERGERGDRGERCERGERWDRDGREVEPLREPRKPI